LLPEDTTAGWALLGASERTKAGSFAKYVDFWNGIDDVRIRGPLRVQGNTVLVNLQFDPKDRRRTLERYQLTMGTAPDGRVLIASAVVIGSTEAEEDRGGRGNRGGRGQQDNSGDNNGNNGNGNNDSNGAGSDG
jgi:hypothetical protein